MTKTKIDMMVFDQACNYLEAEGRLFDRENALTELGWVHLEQPNWQKRVNGMDAEEMAKFIASYVLDPIDEFNAIAEGEYQKSLEEAL